MFPEERGAGVVRATVQSRRGTDRVDGRSRRRRRETQAGVRRQEAGRGRRIFSRRQSGHIRLSPAENSPSADSGTPLQKLSQLRPISMFLSVTPVSLGGRSSKELIWGKKTRVWVLDVTSGGALFLSTWRNPLGSWV